MFLSEAYKSISFVLAFANLGLTIAVISLPDWRINDVEGEVVELIKRTQGLWTKCSFFPTGNWQCEDYDKFFIALPNEIIGARVLTCLALAFQVFTVVLMPFGMYCTRFPEDNLVKTKITAFCSALSLISGIFLGTAVSWYAASVLEHYTGQMEMQMAASNGSNGFRRNGLDSNMSGQRYIYGSALYIGWISMVLLLLQGLLLACSACKNKNGDDNDEQEYGNGFDDQFYGHSSQTKNAHQSFRGTMKTNQTVMSQNSGHRGPVQYI